MTKRKLFRRKQIKRPPDPVLEALDDELIKTSKAYSYVSARGDKDAINFMWIKLEAVNKKRIARINKITNFVAEKPKRCRKIKLAKR